MIHDIVKTNAQYCLKSVEHTFYGIAEKEILTFDTYFEQTI